MKKNLKTVLALLMAVSVMFAFCACGSPAVTVSEEVTAEEMCETTGVMINAPADAADVVYSIEDNSSNADQPMAQVAFKLNGSSYVYRAKYTSEMEAVDISGVDFEPENGCTAEIQGRDGEVKVGKEQSTIFWLDIVPGVAYTLTCSSPVDADGMTALANEIFEPLQGEVDGDM